jgi:hypothetical protein
MTAMDRRSFSSISISSADRRILDDPFNPLHNPLLNKPVLVHQYANDPLEFHREPLS